MRLPRHLMRGLGRNLQACATAIAACACGALAIQGCGIMTSSDCAKRALCQEEAGVVADAASPDNVDGETSAPSEAAVDATTEQDVRSEVDAGDGEAGRQDVASEDVAPEAPPPPPMDGSCNSPYTCAAPVPAGWTGPSLLWADASTPPSCPMNYLQSEDLHQNIAADAGGSCSCKCVLSDDCRATVTFYSDQYCTTACSVPSGMDTPQVSVSLDSGCVPVPDNSCGANGSAVTTNPNAYSASCVPTVTPTLTPAWESSARLCSTTCPAPPENCIIGPTLGFAPTACIYQSGDVACPTTAYVKKTLFYSVNDTRTCSNCMCGSVDGGTCVAGTASYVTVYSNSDCTGGGGYWANLTLDVPCSLYNGTNSTLTNPGSLTYSPAIRHGTCPGVTSPSQFSGSVTTTGTTTVCCM